MRLSNDSMLTIKQAVTLIFGKDAKVYLFGSRTDMPKRVVTLICILRQLA